MPASRAEKIASIIADRQQKGKTIASFQQWLQDVRAGLADFRSQLDLAPRTEAGSTALADMKTAIQAMDSVFWDQYAALEKVRARFAKDTLSIAAVGQARMGKSTFLQSLTGLSNEQIPAQGGRACTSTQSCIVNHSADSGPGYAEVFYYTRQELLDILSDFYPRLHWEHRTFCSLDDFRRDFDSRTPPGPGASSLRPLYDQLKAYAGHVDVLRRFFESNLASQRIPLEKVADFVTYQDGDTRPDNLAVSRVEIHCPFPLEDVGRISVVDTPGMNAASEERDRLILEKVLCDTADFVLFVGIPSIGGVSRKEREMFDNCRRCAPLLDKRAFYIANQAKVFQEGQLVHDGTNELHNRLWQEDFDNHVIPAARLIRVDASIQQGPEGVLAKVLDPVLDYLVATLPGLDGAEIKAAETTIAGDRMRLREFLANARAVFALDAPIDQDVYRRLRALFDRDFPSFSGILQHHLDTLPIAATPAADTGSAPSPYIQCVSAVFCRYRDEVAAEFSLDRVRTEMNATPGQGGAAFFNLLAYLRCYVRDKFSDLENACRGMVEDAKRRLADLFLAPFPDGGGLGSVAELHAPDGTPLRGSDFFFALADLARKAPHHAAGGLAAQFLEFARFELKPSGFIAHGISRALAPLRQNGFRRYRHEPDYSSPESIRGTLLALGEEAVNQVACSLTERTSADPNQAIFAAVENFVDRTLRTRGLHDQWIAFYEGIRADVWPEAFDPDSDSNRFAHRLALALDTLTRLSAS